MADPAAAPFDVDRSIDPALARRVAVPRRRCAVATIVAYGSVGVVALFALSVLLRGDAGYDTLLDGYLYFFTGVPVLVQCLFRAWRDELERRAWLYFAGALGMWCLGNALFMYAREIGLDDPFPWWSDVAWLAFYPAAYVGLVMLMRARSSDVPRSVWFDGAVAGFAVAALVSSFAFGPIVAGATGGRLAVGVNLAYPVGDLVLLALVVCAVTLRGWRFDRCFTLLAAGFVLFAVGDTVYVFQVARDAYVDGTLLDVSWPLGTMLIGLAAYVDRSRAIEDEPAYERWAMLAVPTVFAVSAIALLVVDHFVRLGTVGVVLAAGALLAGMVRVAVTLDEIRALGQSRREARTDELTTLGNRRLFFEVAWVRLTGRSADQPASVLLIDLNRFKEINDSLGHQVGDELLRQIGVRLKSAIREGDVLARLGGDEFAMFVDGAGQDVAVELADRVRACLQDPFMLDGVAVRVGASIGIALYPEHGHDIHTLLQRADVAMYQAKAAERGHEIYVAQRDNHSRERLKSIDELRRGIEDGCLVLHYQPKVNRQRQLVGVEALVRWQHAERGLLYPDAFLPLAEQAGLMRDLTVAVLDAALADSVLWSRRGLHIPVSVNLSVTNLLDQSFVDTVLWMLRVHGADPRLLMFEITENLILVDPDRARDTVVAMRNMGARVSLDDYGTGYSSLTYLRQLPLDELKLDRSFVTELGTDPTATAFFDSAVALARALNLKLVAEGIENEAMWQLALAAGCDVGQGYYFSKPVPSDALVTMIESARRASAVRPQAAGA